MIPTHELHPDYWSWLLPMILVLTTGVKPVSPTMIRLTPLYIYFPTQCLCRSNRSPIIYIDKKISCNQSIPTFLINSWMLAVICGFSWKVLLCFRPPVCVVCPNNEVVVFQPRTGTAPELGSVSNYIFYSNSPAPTVSTGFMDLFISLHYPTAS